MTHGRYDRRFARTIADKTMDELQTIRLAIESNPKNRNPAGSLQIFTAAAQGKLSAIAYAITGILQAKREARAGA